MCMTSSLSNRQVVQILESFLERIYSLSEVQDALRHCLVIDFESAPAQREISVNTLDDRAITIVVRKHHVGCMLQRYMAKEVSELELSNWAALVFMLPTFVPEGETEDDRWENGEGPVWEVLQKLATPQVFDSLDLETVRGYLDLIEKG